MTTARIVERFSMELGEAPPERDSWFLDYVLRSPKHAGIHLTAGWLALSSLRDVYEPEDISFCWEAFGGMGAQALMVQELFAPGMHVVNEYAPEAVEHLRSTMPPEVFVTHGDSYANPNLGADLVMLDFGDLTAWKTRDGELHRQLLDQVFAHEPKAVVFTDIACRYLHLHRERYEGLLGKYTCVDYETYLLALLKRFENLYGYTLVEGYWDRWSAVMALVPSGSAVGSALSPTPAEPVGLQLL